MNAKISVFVICVETIIYLSLYNLHDCTFKIKQRLKDAEEMKCTDEIEHLRNENNSKSTIIKILLENLSILTNATYKHSQNETVVVENYDKNSANVPFKISKRTINVKNVRTGNAKCISNNKMVSPNRFETLSLSNYDRDDFLSEKHAFVSTNIIDKSVGLRNSNTKPDPSQIPLKSPNLNRRPLICTTEKYLNKLNNLKYLNNLNNMIWKDGLHLTNDGTKVLANNFLKYLSFPGNIDFNVNSKKTLMD